MSFSTKAFYTALIAVVVLIGYGHLRDRTDVASNPLQRIADTNEQRLHDIGETIENAD